MDTFLVTGDALALIRLEGLGSAASFIQDLHQLPVTAAFVGLGQRAF
jgi:hypothetical protein